MKIDELEKYPGFVLVKDDGIYSFCISNGKGKHVHTKDKSLMRVIRGTLKKFEEMERKEK